MIVAFLGHATTIFDDNLKNKLREKLLKIIVENEKVDFYLGGYGSFDSGCLTLLKTLKKTYSHINLVFITPYISDNYYKLKTAKYYYDETLYPPIESTPLKFAITKRNEWIVDNCDFLFCYVDRRYGGAYRAYKRALAKKVPLINLADY